MDPKSRHNYRNEGKLQSTKVRVTILQENAAEKLVQFDGKRNLPKSRRAQNHRPDCRRRHEAESRRGGSFARSQNEDLSSARSTT